MKIVVVLSGGMDSATVLAKILADGDEAVTLTFDYGSKHNCREIIAAKNIAKFYGVKNIVIDLPFIKMFFKSNLLKSGGSIPEGHYEDESMKSTVVPFRNGIMLSIAVGYVESIGYDRVAIGNHVGDHAIYPDCRSSFLTYFNFAAVEGTYRKISIYSPFGDLSKTSIVRIGVELKVPYFLTYSCYNGRSNHCGKCGTCVERREAFEVAGEKDPTVYEEN